MDDRTGGGEAQGGRLALYLLGEVTATVAGEAASLGGPRRAALLALLGLESPRALSLSSIVEALWGEQPPESAVNAVQVHVSGLRRLIGREAVITVGNGYRLGPAVTVDVTTFKQGIARGAQQLHRGEAAAAAETLREALTLWTGTPLSGIERSEFTDAAALQLENARLGAVEDLLEADLATGRHHEIQAQLTSLVAEYPLNEHLRALLMQALYQSGRQADALAVYDDCRRILRDELGADPSPELREIQHRLLTQASDVMPAKSHEFVPPNKPLPFLPYETVGREKEIEAVCQLVKGSASRLISVLGPGGVGKTRLATEVGRRLDLTFRDGVVFVPLAEAEKPQDVPSTICNALRIPVGDDPTSTLGAALASRQMLLICDNFEHVSEAALLLPDLFDSAPGLRVLVTTRRALNLRAEQRYVLEPLATGSDRDEAAAIQLFLSRAKAADPAFAPGQGDLRDIAAICRSCDGLPLAVELAAAHIRALSLAELRVQLSVTRNVLDSGSMDLPNRQRTLQASIAWSVGLLPSQDAQFLAQMTAFRGGFTLPAAAFVGDVSITEALKLLETLIDHSLLHRTTPVGSPARFWMLETVREYVHEQIEGSAAKASRARHASYFRGLLDPPPYPADLPETTQDWLVWLAERPNLRQAIRWARENAGSEFFADLVVGAAGIWLENGTPSEMEEWLFHVFHGADTSPGRRCDAAFWLAMTLDASAGRHEAIQMLDNARTLAEEIHDVARLVYVLTQSIQHLVENGQLDDANDALRTVHKLASGHPDSDRLLTRYWMVTAGYALFRGDNEGALAALEAGLELAKPHQHRRMLVLLANLSEVLLLKGEPDKALAVAAEGIVTAQAMEMRRSLGDLLTQRGLAHFALGLAAEAADDLCASLREYLRQGSLSQAQYLEILPVTIASLAPAQPHRAALLYGVYGAYVEGIQSGAKLVRLPSPVEDADLAGLMLEEKYGNEVRSGRELVYLSGIPEAIRQVLDLDADFHLMPD